MAEAFVYCWTDWKYNKLYIGWHKGQIDDGYICSSKYMLKEYNVRGDDFTRQIIASGLAYDMTKLEKLLLTKFDAARSDFFYNKSNNDGSFILDEEVKNKISKSRMGQSRSYASRFKQSETLRREGNHFKGKTHSIATRIHMSNMKKKSSVGNGNSRALTLEYNNKIYHTQDDIAKALNISEYKVRKMRASGEVKTIGSTNGRY